MKIKTEHLSGENHSTATFFNFIKDIRKNLVNSMTVETDSTISHLSNCLIKIEPMQLSKPTKLFGGKVKSIVLNKLSVYQAVVNKEDSEQYTAGNLLFETLLSDESLSYAVFESNSKISPCTYTKVLNDTLKPSEEGEKIKNSLERIESNVVRNDKEFQIRIESLLSLVENAVTKASVPKKDVESILRELNTITNNSVGNLSYSVERLIEELDKDISSIKVELSSTVEKLSRYYSDSNVLRLEAPSDNDEFNILRWILNGEFKTKERVILAKMMESIISSGNLDDEKLKVAKSLHQDFSNPHRIEHYEKAYEANGCLEISKISGEPNLFGTHSSRGRFIEMRFGSARMTSERGSNYLSKIHNICTLALTYEDLLVLLRGNANATLVPCTMTRFAGVGVPFKTISVSKEEKFIDNATKDYKQASSELIKIHNQIKDLLSNPIKKKADKENLEYLISTYIDEFNKNMKKLKGFHSKDCDDIIEHFKEKVEYSVTDLSKCLPDNNKQVLLELIK